jgi:two-component system sensor kinase FixL
LAHELNQPLTALSNYLKAAERTVAAVDDAAVARARELMDKAAGQAMRAGGIIARLRAFIGKDRDKRAAEDANRIVQEALALALVGAAEDNVQLRVELAPHLPKVWVDRIPIQQVVINLVRNAVEAMQAVNDRRLTITTGIDSADVRISVADSGPGLAPDIAERLFQPFRGTKSSGMGLGLSICKTIIDAHGGRLWTEPNSGAGTVFRFTVPVAAD